MPKILVIDDSPVILKLVSQTLSQIGDEILVLASGVQALQRIETFRPDLVILDVMMPELDGYEVCRQIRHNPFVAAVPVMLLTSQNALEEKVKGYEDRDF